MVGVRERSYAGSNFKVLQFNFAEAQAANSMQARCAEFLLQFTSHAKWQMHLQISSSIIIHKESNPIKS